MESHSADSEVLDRVEVPVEDAAMGVPDDKGASFIRGEPAGPFFAFGVGGDFLLFDGVGVSVGGPAETEFVVEGGH